MILSSAASSREAENQAASFVINCRINHHHPPMD